MAEEILFTRTTPAADVIERYLAASAATIAAALYRSTSPRLAQALENAQNRGVKVRLLIDRNKYKESEATREWAARRLFPVRLLYGRRGAGSKMHHKFAILDATLVLTGSYNWTRESEEQNYENLVILRDPQAVESYVREFEALWAEATEL